MKKIIATLLLLATLLTATFAFTACNLLQTNDDDDKTQGDGNDNKTPGNDDDDKTPIDDTVIKIGYMQGPTGMGMAKLIHDNGGVNGNEKYQFVKYGKATDAIAALISGEIDTACLPTNNASIIYNTKNEAVQALAINCLNSLFLMTKTGTTITSFEQLEGKTIYTISNGTPKALPCLHNSSTRRLQL